MSPSSHQASATVDWADPARAVVVAVDGSERNEAAIAYAVHEAIVSGRPLTLLAALDDYTFPIPHRSMLSDDELQWRVLNKIAERVSHEQPGLAVSRDVRFGDTVTTLLDRSAKQGALIVGKRGLGTFGRMLVGSTSIGVAGRSQVPVVIVPDGWQQSEHATGPVVVGVDPEDAQDVVLNYAFAAAQRRQVGLTVVYGIDISPLLVWDAELGAPAYWQERGSEGLTEALAPFRTRYADVSVTVREVRGHPSEVLLEQSAGAQLLVLGRHHESRIGFGAGSVTRAVLHYSEVPVAVVPSP